MRCFVKIKRKTNMKRYLLAVPVAVLMSGVAFAQTTETTAETAGSGTTSNYGTNWSQSIGSTFYSDPEMTTMRTPEEISTGWTSMTQEDRDAVLAECSRFRTDTGADASTDTSAAAGTETATGAETAATDTTTATAAGTDTTTAAGTDTTTATADTATTGTTMASVGVSADSMKMLCDTVESF
jgi:predicted Fe-S protein YdhL (DUF1289 family)